MIKFTYDPEVEATYVSFLDDAKIAKTIVLDPAGDCPVFRASILADVTADGTLIGLEIISL